MEEIDEKDLCSPDDTTGTLRHSTKKESAARALEHPTCPSVKSVKGRKSFKGRKPPPKKPVALCFNNNVLLSPIYNPSNRDSYFSQVFINESCVGEGSFGTVYRVRSREDNMTYVVKRLKSHISYHDRHAEVKNNELLGYNPYLVRYIMAWEENRDTYILMESCDLSLTIFSKTFDVEEELLWRILLDIGNALKFIHDKRFLHLDVKTENIMIKNGIFKLGDFGLLADLRAPDKIVRKSTLSEGDARYLASEILDGIYTYACDIFGLGLTVFEVATDIELPEQGRLWHQLREHRLPMLFHRRVSYYLFTLVTEMTSLKHERRPNADTVLRHKRLVDIANAERLRPRQDFLADVRPHRPPPVEVNVLHTPPTGRRLRFSPFRDPNGFNMDVDPNSEGGVAVLQQDDALTPDNSLTRRRALFAQNQPSTSRDFMRPSTSNAPHTQTYTEWSAEQPSTSGAARMQQPSNAPHTQSYSDWLAEQSTSIVARMTPSTTHAPHTQTYSDWLASQSTASAGQMTPSAAHAPHTQTLSDWLADESASGAAARMKPSTTRAPQTQTYSEWLADEAAASAAPMTRSTIRVPPTKTLSDWLTEESTSGAGALRQSSTMHVPATKTYSDWLADQSTSGAAAGIEPSTTHAALAKTLSDWLSDQSTSGAAALMHPSTSQAGSLSDWFAEPSASCGVSTYQSTPGATQSNRSPYLNDLWEDQAGPSFELMRPSPPRRNFLGSTIYDTNVATPSTSKAALMAELSPFLNWSDDPCQTVPMDLSTSRVNRNESSTFRSDLMGPSTSRAGIMGPSTSRADLPEPCTPPSSTMVRPGVDGMVTPTLRMDDEDVNEDDLDALRRLPRVKLQFD